MNQCIFLPKDIKNIIIEYTFPPNRWIIKNKKEIIKIFKISGALNTCVVDPNLLFNNILRIELLRISKNILKIKQLETFLVTGRYFHYIKGYHNYCKYIYGNTYHIIGLKYLY
jgi:hypothetical protein